MPALIELEAAYAQAAPRPRLPARGARRTCASTPAARRRCTSRARLTERLGGAKIYLKREDLCHTGAHKINNTIGQGLLARRMGKPRIIAETGAGQHGVATATVTALLGLQCEVFMGAEDVRRQSLNVFRMKLLGATVHPVYERQRDAEGRDERGAARLGDERAHDLLPGRLDDGAAPVPDDRARLPVGHRPRGASKQILEREGRLPDYLIACVGGGSNAMGLFHPFIGDAGRGDGRRRSGRRRRRRAGATRPRSPAARSASCTARRPTCCRTSSARSAQAHSISAGLDYPGRRPGARLPARHRTGAVRRRHRRRGARGPAAADRDRGHHSGARVGARDRLRHRSSRRPWRATSIIVVNLSGRGDKDMNTVASYLGVTL